MKTEARSRPPRRAVRGQIRSSRTPRSGRPRASLPWYLRKRIVFPCVFLASALAVAAFCWWHIPVTNTLTGEIENYGTRATRALHGIVNPKQSLDVAFSGRRQVSVLLVGLDHIPPTPGDPGIIRRCDSVMVTTTSFDTKQIRVVSIPRDGWVQHWQDGRNFGYERLGNTYSLGQERDLSDPLAGLNRTHESVSRLLGMPIDFYVIIEFEGLVELVDALGGLEVDVEMDMDRDDNAGNLHIHLKQGLQHLSGEQVMQYARYRDPKLADLGRMPRQQKVVRLLLQEIMQARHLTRLPELAGILYSAVTTNLTPDQLLALAQHIDEYSPDCIQTTTMASFYDMDPTMPEIQCPGVPEGEKVGAQCIYPRDARHARDFLQDLSVPAPEPEEPEPPAGDEPAPGTA